MLANNDGMVVLPQHEISFILVHGFKDIFFKCQIKRRVCAVSIINKNHFNILKYMDRLP